jgi:hypothetical protein
MEKAQVKVANDGRSIDFVQADTIPASPKKFRQSQELKEFYRFLFDNDLRREALSVVDQVLLARRMKKAQEKSAKSAARKRKRAQ